MGRGQEKVRHLLGEGGATLGIYLFTFGGSFLSDVYSSLQILFADRDARIVSGKNCTRGLEYGLALKYGVKLEVVPQIKTLGQLP